MKKNRRNNILSFFPLLRAKTIYTGCVILLLLASAGCKASYPKETILESIVLLCKNETGQKVETILRGKTLYTILHMQNLLTHDLQLSEKTIDTIQNVMMCVNRVSLSTNAEIDFFVVVVIDDVSGVEIVFTQYVDDLRRWMLSNISRDDFYSRSLTDISVQKPGFIIDPSSFTELTMPVFIARQVAARVKKNFEKDMVMQILMNIENIEGTYHDGIFDYVIRKISKNTPIQTTVKNKTFNISDTLTNTHFDVCKKYKFNTYRIIRIQDETGHILKETPIKTITSLLIQEI